MLSDKGFLGYGHFSKCNELRVAAGKQPIDWAHVPPEKKPKYLLL